MALAHEWGLYHKMVLLKNMTAHQQSAVCANLKTSDRQESTNVPTNLDAHNEVLYFRRGE